MFQLSDIYIPLVENYQNNNFHKDDFLLRALEEGLSEPIDWWEKAESMNLTEAEKHVIDVSKNKFGITKGIGFPTLGNSLGVAGVSIINFKNEDLYHDISSEIISELHKCIKIYHDHMMGHQDERYKFILPLLNSLSNKQMIVIEHLISGQAMKKIENRGITERYGEKLLYKLRKSFGGVSKNELIYLLGLLNIAEYFNTEEG